MSITCVPSLRPYSLLTHFAPQPNSSKKYLPPLSHQSRADPFHPARKKFYLVLFAGQPDNTSLRRAQQVPTGLGLEGADQVRNERKRERVARAKGNKRKAGKTVDWILKKKELYRARGKEGVPRDSKCVFLLPEASCN